MLWIWTTTRNLWVVLLHSFLVAPTWPYVMLSIWRVLWNLYFSWIVLGWIMKLHLGCHIYKGLSRLYVISTFMKLWTFGLYALSWTSYFSIFMVVKHELIHVMCLLLSYFYGLVTLLNMLVNSPVWVYFHIKQVWLWQRFHRSRLKCGCFWELLYFFPFMYHFSIIM